MGVAHVAGEEDDGAARRMRDTPGDGLGVERLLGQDREIVALDVG
jgi:hypothetical protein